jgi:hypothetical protein
VRTDTTLTRRTAKASLSAAAALLPPETASALSGSKTTTDPIFSVIAAYKQALAERLANQDESREHDLAKREFELHNDLLTTKPTTIGGVAALLDLLGDYPYEDKGTDGAETVIEMGFTLDQGGTARDSFPSMATIPSARPMP